jgi:cell division protein FtsB
MSLFSSCTAAEKLVQEMSRMTLEDMGGVTPPPPQLPSTRRRLRTTQELLDRRRKRITLGLSLALCVLLVNSIVGENGYLATLRIRQEKADLEATVAALRRQNQQLQGAGNRLDADSSALEEEARRSLGMIRPGETLIIYREARPAVPDRSR